MSQMTVKLDKIIVHDQARKIFDEDEDRRLGENIKQYGLLQPLLVKRRGELFDLVAGERRLRAMKMVGITECQVIVLKDMDAGDTEVVQWIENAQRADLLPTEKAHALLGIKMKRGWNNKQCAEHLHMKDASLVTRYLSFFDTIPAVREAAEAGKIGPAAWYQISLLPESDQSGLLELHLSGLPTAQIAEISRKKRQPGSPRSALKVSRIKCQVPGKGATIVVSGEAISLGDMIEAMTELLKEAKKASERGLDAKTFERVCRDLAKKG
jgi:ParB family chromosome partitioning protein